ncbi:hypothetical protein AB0D34_17965 [Streptomyces sp. NPDC048420]|uniref:hypothetical protein n=1 Tax=Streptomyces sp. NPDC048420 TaxID=3155755 RepID=UPI0034249C65
MTVRDYAACRASLSIGFSSERARERLTGLPAKDLTRARVQQALALPGQSYEVEDVVREGRTVTVRVLVRDTSGAAQCYRYTRPVDPAADRRETTAVPVAACREVPERPRELTTLRG